MLFDDPQMLYLGLDEFQKKAYADNKIEYSKQMGARYAKARKDSKLDHCYYCNKSVSSFCNSHSVPQFCLKRIASDGKVYYANTLIDLPFMRNDQGVKEAGTFQIICRECDSKIFQQYEDPNAYQTIPSSRILAQIAMKNYLQMIYKRLYESKLYSLLEKETNRKDILDRNQKVISLDLDEYNRSFTRARQGALGGHDDWYYLCYYQKLDYMVPLAFQGGIVLVSDFEDNLVNNIYNFNLTYHPREIHIAVFPLESESVVMLFTDTTTKCYRKFYRQLSKLSLSEQLAAINYIIFSYSENVYMSKRLNEDVLKNQNLINTSKKSSIAIANHPFADALSSAIMEFSLSKRNEIPNLLSKEYAIS